MNLDKCQLDVVNCKDNCLVIAGPGSGKSRVIVEKANALSGEVLVLTHTKAAKWVLRKRGVKASTIHSVAYKGLGFPVFDTFDGLLTYRGNKDFDWVLVDEAQDLSYQQYEVIKSLGKNFVFVGDPYQSIFGFGGSYPYIFDDFKREFSPIELPLNYNYRSNEEVVRVLNEIFPRGLISKCNGITKRDIAILVRTRIEAEGISSLLRKFGRPHILRTGEHSVDYGGDSLYVLTIHCAKGTEFDSVGILPWELSSEEELRVHYVATARARYRTATIREVLDIALDV